MNQSYNVNRSVQSIHFKRLTWYNIFRISLSIPLSTLFSVPRYINTHICQSRIYIHTYLLSTCWLFCPRPRPFASSLLRLHLHIYWSKHLMVASIQRILLHAAAYHKSTVLFLRFQPSSVFSNFNFEFVSSLFDSSLLLLFSYATLQIPNK